MSKFTDISDPILDMKTGPLRDQSIDEIEFYEHWSIDANARNNIELTVNNTDQYTLPSEAYIEVAGRVTKADGTAYAATDQVALVNNGIAALFKDMRYEINGQVIEQLNQNAAITSTILGLARYSENYGKTVGTGFHWGKDTSDHADSNQNNSITVKDTQAGAAEGTTVNVITGKNENYNQGFAIRHSLLFGGGNTGYFNGILPLSCVFGFCRDIRKVIYGVRHTIRLQRANDDEAIHRSATATNGKITLNRLSLWMPVVTPNLAWKTALQSWMVNKNSLLAYYQCHQVDDRTSNVRDLTWKLAVRSGIERPRHIFIAFQNQDRRNSQIHTPMVFDNLGLTDIRVTLNSKVYPASNLSINFPERNYARAYKLLMDFEGHDQDVDSGTQISYSDFRSLFPIYHFDLEKQEEGMADSIVDIYVRATFSDAHEYRAYAIVLSDKYVKLESDGSKINIF